MKISYAIKFTALAIAASTLVACGGGGGGTSSSSPNSGGSAGGNVQTQNAMNETNYFDVTRAAISSASYSAKTSEFVTGVERDSRIAYNNHIVSQTVRLMRSKPKSYVLGAQVSSVERCEGGGSVAYENNISSDNSIQDGDSLRAIYSNCVEFGIQMNGEIFLRFIRVSGDIDTDVYSVDTEIRIVNFSEGDVNSGDFSSGTGSLALSIDSRALDESLIKIEAGELEIFQHFRGISSKLFLTGFNLVIDSTSSAVSLTAAGNFSASDLANGTVFSVSTPTAIRTPNGANNPTSGVLVILGGGSKVTMTAQQNNTVLIQLDNGADGTVESSVTKTWPELGFGA